MYEDGSGEKREIVSGIEAVPERAEEEHGERAVTPLVDDVAQPLRRHLVPVVQYHLQARRKLTPTGTRVDDFDCHRYKADCISLSLSLSLSLSVLTAISR